MFLMLPAASAHAVDPGEILSDPALEKRARGLSYKLRCLVCQNQSIDDSNAPLAKDLRVLVRERLVEGDTDKQVIDFIVARYGQFVLLQPQFNATTLLLWITPLLLLLFGAITLYRRSTWSVKTASSQLGQLTDEERGKLDRLLKNDDAS